MKHALIAMTLAISLLAALAAAATGIGNPYAELAPQGTSQAECRPTAAG